MNSVRNIFVWINMLSLNGHFAEKNAPISSGHNFLGAAAIQCQLFFCWFATLVQWSSATFSQSSVSVMDIGQYANIGMEQNQRNYCQTTKFICEAMLWLDIVKFEWPQHEHQTSSQQKILLLLCPKGMRLRRASTRIKNIFIITAGAVRWRIWIFALPMPLHKGSENKK